MLLSGIYGPPRQEDITGIVTFALIYYQSAHYSGENNHYRIPLSTMASDYVANITPHDTTLVIGLRVLRIEFHHHVIVVAIMLLTSVTISGIAPEYRRRSRRRVMNAGIDITSKHCHATIRTKSGQLIVIDVTTSFSDVTGLRQSGDGLITAKTLLHTIIMADITLAIHRFIATIMSLVNMNRRSFALHFAGEPVIGIAYATDCVTVLR